MNSTRVALVTGGSRGIGLAIVQKLKKEGWWVSTCATQGSRLQNNPADDKFVCDVSSSTDVVKNIERIYKTKGPIHLLVNNAGLAGNNPMDPRSSDELWHRIIDVNLNGTYYFCKYSAPYLADGESRIVNIASVLALKGVPDAIAYCAAKHGVLGLTRALAHFFAPRKITVNAVCPGWVQTEMAAERLKEIGITETQVNSTVPLGRIIQPSEIAELVYFLGSSEGATMISGQALTADGGWLA